MREDEKIIKNIKTFFDLAATKRDKEFRENPVLGYEQDVRRMILFDMIMPEEGDIILEVGCGNGRDAPFYLSVQGVKYTGMDISEKMLVSARKKIEKLDKKGCAHFLIADATNIPFPDNLFDKIVCSEVLEHIPRWDRAIGEFARTIKNGGVLVITTPNQYSMYGMTRMVYEKTKGTSHPFDSWKNYWLLKKNLLKNLFFIEEIRGACYLPGLLSYMTQIEKLLKRILPVIRKIEESFLSKNRITRYFGYMIAIKCKSPSPYIN